MSRITALPRIAILLLLLAGAACATPEEPPPFPNTDRNLSVTPRGWMVDVLGWLYVDGRGTRRIVEYLADQPGDIKIRVYKYRAKPRPEPEEVHRFYTEWAKRAGYRLMVEVRLGRTPPDWRFDDSNRPYKPKPPKLVPRRPWEREERAWVDAFHRPGPDGGVLVSVWTQFRHVWVWKPGECCIGPVLGEYLGLPRTSLESSPPTATSPWSEPLDFPVVPEDQAYVRVEAGKEELDAACHDLSARTAQLSERTPLEAFLAASPQAFEPVKHAWVVTFRDEPEARARMTEPWAAWAEARGWMKMPLPPTQSVPVRAWVGGGPKGGALVMFDVEWSTVVLVFDGTPNLFALMPLLHMMGQGGSGAK